MGTDGFSKCHPMVNFLFFIGAVCFGVVFQHPLYLLAALLCAGTYSFLLQGRKALKQMAWMLPLLLVIALINPLFNTRGERILFLIFGRPYTLEALLYGFAVGIPNFFSARFLLGALEHLPAVIVYPTYSVATILLITLGGTLFFREHLKKHQWVALAIILLALVLLNM